MLDEGFREQPASAVAWLLSLCISSTWGGGLSDHACAFTNGLVSDESQRQPPR